MIVALSDDVAGALAKLLRHPFEQVPYPLAPQPRSALAKLDPLRPEP
jgi:hypothetical protein